MSSLSVRKRVAAGPILLLLLMGLPGHAQYVGKVGQATEKKNTLRATAVYEYTGSMTKPTASRLVPVVVWDGERYQPGGLYLAQPEPLAVAPGTQYVLEQSGVPAGLFNLSSAGQLNGNWVGLGRFAIEPATPPPAKLARSKKPPTLTGGTGRGKITVSGSDSGDDSNGPVLHRKAGSESDTSTASTSTSSGSSGSSGSSSGGTSPTASNGSGPTLHRRDTTDTTDSTSSTDSSSSSSGSTTDPDRPTLHRKDTDTSDTSGNGSTTTASSDPDRPTLHRSTDTGSGASPVDPDRPTLHRHADTGTLETTAPDPDRPHLRYGEAGDVNSRVMPTELKEFSTPGMAALAGAAGGAGSGAPVTIGQTVAISDTQTDEPHPFRFTWPSPTVQTDTEAAMRAFALRALATAAQATFGPAAKASQKTAADLQQAATAAEHSVAATSAAANAPAQTTPSKSTPGTRARHTTASAPMADPLTEAQFTAFELSYGAGVTYIYSAHTNAADAADRRYVTVIAQPDFYGKPHLVFSQTTRGDQLNQVPAMHLIDAVDADGDHRAELLFELEGGAPDGQAPPARQFALYSVTAGKAAQVYTSNAGAGQ